MQSRITFGIGKKPRQLFIPRPPFERAFCLRQSSCIIQPRTIKNLHQWLRRKSQCFTFRDLNQVLRHLLSAQSIKTTFESINFFWYLSQKHSITPSQYFCRQPWDIKTTLKGYTWIMLNIWFFILLCPIVLMFSFIILKHVWYLGVCKKIDSKIERLYITQTLKNEKSWLNCFEFWWHILHI